MADINTYLDIASKVVAGAAAVAAITPTPKDDNILYYIRKVIDLLAFNVFNAKNK